LQEDGAAVLVEEYRRRAPPVMARPAGEPYAPVPWRIVGGAKVAGARHEDRRSVGPADQGLLVFRDGSLGDYPNFRPRGRDLDPARIGAVGFVPDLSKPELLRVESERGVLVPDETPVSGTS
jgi:hypothetical protein